MTVVLALDDLGAFRSSDFQTSLVVGAAALVVGALCVSRRRRTSEGRLFAAVLPIAWLVAVAVVLEPPVAVTAGVALLFLAGLVHDVGRVPLTLSIAFASIGAWVLSDGGDYVELSAPVAFMLVVAVGAAFTGYARIEHSAAGVLPVVVLSLMGAYATLPDTEAVVVALGASVPLLFLAWPDVQLRLGAAGAFALGGLFVHTFATGWGGRESAVVGAVGALGLVVVAPLVVHADGRARAFWLERARPVVFFAAVLGLHLALVLFCARVAGLRASVALAVLLAVVALAGGAAALLLLARLGALHADEPEFVIDLRSADGATTGTTELPRKDRTGVFTDEPSD